MKIGLKKYTSQKKYLVPPLYIERVETECLCTFPTRIYSKPLHCEIIYVSRLLCKLIVQIIVYLQITQEAASSNIGLETRVRPWLKEGCEVRSPPTKASLSLCWSSASSPPASPATLAPPRPQVEVSANVSSTHIFQYLQLKSQWLRIVQEMQTSS